MSRAKCAAMSVNTVESDKYARVVQFPRVSAFDMSKTYQVVRDRIPRVGGGFVEAFRMALVDFSCFGERHLDLTGYPHESEAAALMSDWAALGGDFRAAAERAAAPAEREGSGDGASRSARRPAEAASD